MHGDTEGSEMVALGEGVGLAAPDGGGFDVVGAAVVVVDMQNDFCSPLGMVGRRGVDLAPIQALVKPIRRVLSVAKRRCPVVYLKMGYHPDLSDTGGPDAPNWFKVHAPAGVGQTIVLADGTTSRILIRDTWNTEIIDELAPEPGDLAMYKHRFSGFYETDLDQTLRALGVRTLIFTGCTTSVCVESTVRDRSSTTIAACSSKTVSRNGNAAATTPPCSS